MIFTVILLILIERLAHEPLFQELSSYPPSKTKIKTENKNESTGDDNKKNNSTSSNQNTQDEKHGNNKEKNSRKNKNDENSEDDDNDNNALKWVFDANCQFKKDQIKLKISDDPNDW